MLFLYKSFFSFLFFLFFLLHIYYIFFYIKLSFAIHEVILAKRIRISCHSVLLTGSLNAHVAFVRAQQKFRWHGCAVSPEPLLRICLHWEIPVHLLSYINPFKPNAIFHPYQMDESVYHNRDVMYIYHHFNRHLKKEIKKERTNERKKKERKKEITKERKKILI